MESVQSRIAQIYHKLSSQRAFEEMLSMAGIAYFERRNEGQPIQYQQIESRYKSRFTHLGYAAGLRFTERVVQDELYGQISEAGQQFGMSAMATMEVLGAYLFNTGESVVWNAEEGMYFFDTLHPLSTRAVTSVKTYDNIISGDPDYDSIQEAILMLEGTPNDMGYPSHMRATYIYYNPKVWDFLIDSWFNSPGRYNSANLEKNTIKGRIIPVPWEYLATDRMIVQGSTFRTYWFDRNKVTTDHTVDFDTDDLKYKAKFSCSQGAADWRGFVAIIP
jgi:hypothetical protein